MEGSGHSTGLLETASAGFGRIRPKDMGILTGDVRPTVPFNLKGAGLLRTQACAGGIGNLAISGLSAPRPNLFLAQDGVFTLPVSISRRLSVTAISLH